MKIGMTVKRKSKIIVIPAKAGIYSKF